ncbi:MULTISPECIES: ribonuclease HII [unclassified Iodidimonas]|jgi:ribonuclease HII|uniref:ribonuclease HII n=1 Tax=unclassified Iodidimonas TaxID=2626145 RepID=UPI0024824B67|nr:MULTISPECIES: ribonuclease HII [unclassified Iodidimonas]
MPDFSHEQAFLGLVAGIDEAGRGPLAGPVVAAAVIFDRTRPLDPSLIGLDDSKKLSKGKRLALFDAIKRHALSHAIALATVEEIDHLNILQASLLAMRRAVAQLEPAPIACLVDGNRDPGLPFPSQCIIKGDHQSLSIAAASILAKVTRDRIMEELARDWPHYEWQKNAGYGVPAHLEALRLVGPSPHHRKSFAPVRKIRL